MGLSPGLLKLLATFGGEVIPSQGLHLVGVGRRVIYSQECWLSETAVGAGLPVKLGLGNGTATLPSLHAGSHPGPSIKAHRRTIFPTGSPSALSAGKGEEINLLPP